MLDKPELEFLKHLYGRLHDEPLDIRKPDDQPLYEPIYKPTPDHEEPIDLLARHVFFSQLESVQFFSGFRGSGKTTELLRLRQKLAQADLVVLYASALDYINPAGPIDISDLLISLGGAFNDSLTAPDVLGQDHVHESYWARIDAFLRKTKLHLELGVRAGLDVKLAMRSSPTFRQRLQTAMAERIGELKAELDEFIDTGVKSIWQYQGRVRPIVFLFDSLEQIRGAGSNERDVLSSVESLFRNHFDKLRLPGIHVIYTVPPWLKFILPGAGRIEILPNVRLWHNDAARTPFPAGRESLRSLVRRRLGDDGYTRLLGTEPALLDRVIDACGGHLRDLLLLLREIMLRAQELPITADVIDRAITAVRRQYVPIAVDDAAWLARIEQSRSAELRSGDAIGRLMRFLDSHMVLYLMNGEEWYDVHPLIREEVQRMVTRPDAGTSTAAVSHGSSE